MHLPKKPHVLGAESFGFGNVIGACGFCSSLDSPIEEFKADCAGRRKGHVGEVVTFEGFVSLWLFHSLLPGCYE